MPELQASPQQPASQPATPSADAPGPAVQPPGGWPVSVQAVQGLGPVTARQLYQAAVAQRSELRSQLSRLQDQRSEVASQLRSEAVVDADRTGLEARLNAIDANIASVDGQLAQAELAVAKAVAVPGAVVTPSEPAPSSYNWMDSDLTVVFTLFVLAPVSLAIARRIWKRSTQPPSLKPEFITSVDRRLDELQQAVDSVAVETERIGESQRFLTRVLGERERVPLNQG